MPRTRSVILQLVALGVLVGALALLNTLPSLCSDAAVRRYPSIDEARIALGWHRAMMPAYFPSYIAWPPREVIAGKQPVPMLVALFTQRGGDEVVLAVAQVEASREEVPLAIEPIDQVQRTTRTVNGREAIIWRGRCRDGGVCSKISWQDGPYHLSIGLRDGIDELVRMAQSAASHL